MQTTLNHMHIEDILCAFQACSSDLCGRIFTTCAKPGTTRPLVFPAPSKAWFLARPFAASHEDAKDKQKPAEQLRVSAALV